MCRSIHPLFNVNPPTTEDEIQAAALQYVRKVSGYRKPSQANQAAFEQAVQGIADATRGLLAQLETAAPPRDLETLAARARARRQQG